MPPPSPKANRRAALLAVLIAVQVWLALPIPPPLHPHVARRPAVAEELDRWYEVLSKVGLFESREALITFATRASTALHQAHIAVIRPIQPLLRATGTGQAWPLFASPETHPWRLEIHARVEGDWKLVFRRLSPEHDLMAEVVRYRRIRGIYNAPGRRGPYPRLANWLGQHTLLEVPEAGAARVQLVRLHTTRPHEAPDPKTRARHRIVVERAP